MVLGSQKNKPLRLMFFLPSLLKQRFLLFPAGDPHSKGISALVFSWLMTCDSPFERCGVVPESPGCSIGAAGIRCRPETLPSFRQTRVDQLTCRTARQSPKVCQSGRVAANPKVRNAEGEGAGSLFKSMARFEGKPSEHQSWFMPHIEDIRI